jgi:hypothetical protein
MAIKYTVHVACIGEMRNMYNIFVCEPEGKRLLERSRSKGEDNTHYGF